MNKIRFNLKWGENMKKNKILFLLLLITVSQIAVVYGYSYTISDVSTGGTSWIDHLLIGENYINIEKIDFENRVMTTYNFKAILNKNKEYFVEIYSNEEKIATLKMKELIKTEEFYFFATPLSKFTLGYIFGKRRVRINIFDSAEEVVYDGKHLAQRGKYIGNITYDVPDRFSGCKVPYTFPITIHRDIENASYGMLGGEDNLISLTSKNLSEEGVNLWINNLILTPALKEGESYQLGDKHFYVVNLYSQEFYKQSDYSSSVFIFDC
jgi:hypothetical protein